MTRAKGRSRAKASKAVAHRKQTPARAGGASKRREGAGSRPVDEAPSPSVAPPAPRELTTLKADVRLESVVGSWREAVEAFKRDELLKKLGKSAFESLADTTGADIILTASHGHVAKITQRGQVDYERLARELLGDAKVDKLAESYRKPSSTSWVTPAWWGSQ